LDRKEIIEKSRLKPELTTVLIDFFTSLHILDVSQERYSLSTSKRDQLLENPLKERLELKREQNKLGNRLSLLETNLFEQKLPKAKLFLCGFLLHDFHKEAAQFILEQIYKSLLPDGILILHENLIDHPDKDVRLPLLLDQFSFLLKMGRHGQYRSSEDYRIWLEEIGFKYLKTEFSTPKSFMFFKR
jgi:SAM-dependent methyltransferase